MSDDATPSIDLVVALVPLAKSIAWIALIVWVLKRYGSTIAEVLDIVKNRIRTGSSMKAGSFELGEQITAQSSQSQVDSANEEIKALQVPEIEEGGSGGGLETDSEDEGAQPPDGNITPPQISKIREVFEAEDLALRAYQEESDVPLVRNVRLLGNFQADGYYRAEQKEYLVEVKIVSTATARSAARNALTSLDSVVKEHLHNKMIIILILVFTDAPPSDKQVDIIKSVTERFDLTVQVKTYSIQELRRKFDILVQAW